LTRSRRAGTIGSAWTAPETRGRSRYPGLDVPIETLLVRFAGFVPDARTALLLAPLALAYGAAAAWAVARLHDRAGVRTPYTRKVFHFAVFTAATLVQIRWGLPGVSVFGAVISLIVLYIVARGDAFPAYEALARPSDEPHRHRFVLIPLLTTALGGGIANLAFPGFAWVGYLVCGWGDAVGEPVGTRWGRHRYRVPSMAGVPATRSLEGSAAVLLVGALAAFSGLLAVGRTPLEAGAIALAAGSAGALVEAFSTHGLDNLTVQVAATAAAWWVGG
jgi:phytol kinase